MNNNILMQNSLIFWGSQTFSTICSLVGFILLAVAFASIARKKGIKNRWTAWVPIIQSWMLGCIADKYNYVVRDKKTCLRGILLVLSVLFGASYIIAQVVGLKTGYGMYDAAHAFIGSSFVMIVLNVLFGLLRWISCYKVLRFCGVRHRILLIILMMIGGGLAQGIILFCVSRCENADTI